jgi:hypothetical protein
LVVDFSTKKNLSSLFFSFGSSRARFLQSLIWFLLFFNSRTRGRLCDLEWAAMAGIGLGSSRLWQPGHGRNNGEHGLSCCGWAEIDNTAREMVATTSKRQQLGMGDAKRASLTGWAGVD